MSIATFVMPIGIFLASATVAAIVLQVRAMSQSKPPAAPVAIRLFQDDMCFDFDECVVCAVEDLITRDRDAQTVADAERWGRELGGSR